MTCFVQADGSGGCWGQVDVSASNPWAAVVDTDRDTSAMTNANLGADRQSAMGGCHRRAIQSLSTRSLVAAETVTSAIDTRYFCMRRDD